MYAQPDRSGFFGLSQLQVFTETTVEPHSRVESDITFVLDFSQVKVWDISALLWLIVALHHYRQSGFKFLLRLPEANGNMSQKEIDSCEKSADFLRRWEFDTSLRNLAPDVDSLLVPEQGEYFSQGPRRFYKEKTIASGYGILDVLISQRLVGIKNLSDLDALRSKGISDRLITACIANFQSARIGDILRAQCGLNRREADLFADHLLSEALMNVKEHPQATIGMISVSIMGNTNELILAVADNGAAIPETIYPSYTCKQGSLGAEGAAAAYCRDALSDEERAIITHYATLSGVSSKVVTGDKEIGMGLTYIRDDTVNLFGGKLRIVTESVSIEYKGDVTEPPDPNPWQHSWRGYLLRIAIPISRKASRNKHSQR